jgi:hypothetical protein
MNDRSTLVDRLNRKTVAGEPVFPTPIELEAADRIAQLEAALTEILESYQYMAAWDIARKALNREGEHEAD